MTEQTPREEQQAAYQKIIEMLQEYQKRPDQHKIHITITQHRPLNPMDGSFVQTGPVLKISGLVESIFKDVNKEKIEEGGIT